MTDNMSLWHAVEKTPKEHTKSITGKPYRGTSPKPYWLIQKATETFGPCGIGWGFKILSERVEDGAAGDKVHIAHIRLWFDWNGKRGEIEHVGQTMFSGKNKNGPYTDEDAPKKSVTDALVKALSMAGFAGDIFIGRYDDSKYVSELEAEARASETMDRTPSRGAAAAGGGATLPSPPPAPPSTEQKALFNDLLSAANLAENTDALRDWWRTHLEQAKANLTAFQFDDLKERVVALSQILSAREAAQ